MLPQRTPPSVATADISLGEREHELMALCSRGEVDSAELPLTGRDPEEACPFLFFSGWRAETSGKREDAAQIRTLRQHGRPHVPAMADRCRPRAAMDRKRTAARRLRRLELVAEQDGGAVRVRRVIEGLAGDLQDLKAADTVVTCNNEPASIEVWNEACARLEVGLPMRLTVLRSGATRVLWLHAGLEPR